jgi:hypothetical protein
MASIFPFRTRSQDRDDATDAARMGRLRALVTQIASEIEFEKAGLEARYRSETADAGFLFEALANDDASARSAARADELTASILRGEQRLAALEQQAAFVSELRLLLETFGERGGFANAPAEEA